MSCCLFVGHTSIVNALLGEGGAIIDLENRNGETALFWASIKGIRINNVMSY